MPKSLNSMFPQMGRKKSGTASHSVKAKRILPTGSLEVEPVSASVHLPPSSYTMKSHSHDSDEDDGNDDCVSPLNHEIKNNAITFQRED